MTSLLDLFTVYTSHSYIGVVYFDLKNYNKACEYLQKATDLGYEKTHDRYDLKAFLEQSCKSFETIENTIALEDEPIQTLKLVDKAYVYPNPAKGIINIKNLPFKHYRYLIFDYAGRLITKGISNENNSINLSNLPMAVYILKAAAKHEAETFRIIKE